MSSNSKTRILLVASNGGGLGHLTRQLAVALAIGDRAETTMFSLSPGFPLVMRFGIQGEYCPSFTTPWIVRKEWDDYLKDRFLAFASEVEPDVVLFDGVAPYTGFLRAAGELPGPRFGWLRRGMWREGSNEQQLNKIGAFDFVIEPLDLASAIDSGATSQLTDAVRVPPISLIEVIDQLDRETAASKLGIDPNRPALLLTLGSGRLGDVEGPGSAALGVALEHDDWQICVANSPVAVNLVPRVDSKRVIELNGVYPLLRYLKAFDATVSAAGYNSVHELIPAGVPTLLVANTSAKTDNQEARSEYLAELGLALVARDDDLEAVARETSRLLDPDIRARLVEQHRSSGVASTVGGAAAVASELIRPPEGGKRARLDETWKPPLSSRIANRVLGEKGKAMVKKALGREVADYSDSHTRVRIGDPHGRPATDVLTLLLTSDSDQIDPSADYPTEHLLEGSSDSYRRERLEIVRRYYDVVSD